MSSSSLDSDKLQINTENSKILVDNKTLKIQADMVVLGPKEPSDGETKIAEDIVLFDRDGSSKFNTVYSYYNSNSAPINLTDMARHIKDYLKSINAVTIKNGCASVSSLEEGLLIATVVQAAGESKIATIDNFPTCKIIIDGRGEVASTAGGGIATTGWYKGPFTWHVDKTNLVGRTIFGSGTSTDHTNIHALTVVRPKTADDILNMMP